ncbi:MAG TPA: hypothetical protein VN634_01680 [Candidatus Limnocylindrales bacterium]|nr:hypothetical protein [Candidatus Limnocylindrales bacterium]
MTRIRRGNYIFVTWRGDHLPRRLHVYRDGRLIVKWNLETNAPIAGVADARVRWMIASLRREKLV